MNILGKEDKSFISLSDIISNIIVFGFQYLCRIAVRLQFLDIIWSIFIDNYIVNIFAVIWRFSVANTLPS